MEVPRERAQASRSLRLEMTMNLDVLDADLDDLDDLDDDEEEGEDEEYSEDEDCVLRLLMMPMAPRVVVEFVVTFFFFASSSSSSS
mmetsp:Transcript_21849/g.39921  ORF Transcript_21849/g.39921 Transcript_21849/m.39921 type:complete len:86 (+) Transcript_21849:473-730(+)